MKMEKKTWNESKKFFALQRAKVANVCLVEVEDGEDQ